jgi:hypothetical protein
MSLSWANEAENGRTKRAKPFRRDFLSEEERLDVWKGRRISLHLGRRGQCVLTDEECRWKVHREEGAVAFEEEVSGSGSFAYGEGRTSRSNP